MARIYLVSNLNKTERGIAFFPRLHPQVSLLRRFQNIKIYEHKLLTISTS